MLKYFIGGAVIAICAFGAGLWFAPQNLGSGSGTFHNFPEVFTNAVTIQGTATTTLSSHNLVSNSTSTGIVLRATNGSCYLLQLVVTGGTTNLFTTSTSACN